VFYPIKFAVSTHLELYLQIGLKARRCAYQCGPNERRQADAVIAEISFRASPPCTNQNMEQFPDLTFDLHNYKANILLDGDNHLSAARKRRELALLKSKRNQG
jgi:hypothetical protein